MRIEAAFRQTGIGADVGAIRAYIAVVTDLTQW